MASRMTRVLAIVALGGIVVQFGGCLGGGMGGHFVSSAAWATAYEFVWDNGAVLDLFQDETETDELLGDVPLTDPPEVELEGLMVPGPLASE